MGSLGAFCANLQNRPNVSSPSINVFLAIVGDSPGELVKDCIVLKRINHLQREGLSVIEASEVAGLRTTTLYMAISSGALKSRKFGRRRVILCEGPLNFLSSLPVIQETRR
jgi:hypothetical protein